MTAAVLFCGQFRTFENIFPQVDVSKFFDCDYYISTWNYSKQQYDNDEEFDEFDVTPELIKKIIPNVKYDIVDEKNIFKTEVPTTNKLFFQWKNALNLLLSQNKKYDIIFLSRMDSLVRFRANIIPKFTLDENVIYGELLYVTKVNPFEFGTFDRYFFGGFDIMKRFIETLPDFQNQNLKFDCHRDLANHIIYNVGTHVSDIHPFCETLVRPHKF